MFTAIRHRLTATLITGLAAFTATAAHAGDFQPKRVAADAKWLAFVNVEGLVNSTLGKFMIEHGDDLGFELDDMQEVEAQIGINPMKDIRSVTIYGEGNPEDHQNFVALFDTTAAIDDTIARFTAQTAGDDAEDGDDIASIDINGQKVHVMSDGEQATYVAVRPGPISDSRVVIVTLSRDWMSKGLNVLDGKAAGLDRATKPLVASEPAAGTLMFVSANDLSWIDFGHGHDDDGDDDDGHDNAHQAAHSEIMKAARGVEIVFGETGSDTFLNARMQTGSAEDAQNLSDIMRGLVAMARFAANQDDNLKPLLAPTKSLQLKTDGATISMSMKHSTQGIIDALKAAHAHEHGDDDDHDHEVEVKASVKLHGGDDAKGKHDDDHDHDDHH